VFCQFQETPVVVTNVGDVTAGTFAYGETFSRCSVCTSSMSMACPADHP
jgi:hypothetical protein